jgi:hypothetical protein
MLYNSIDGVGFTENEPLRIESMYDGYLVSPDVTAPLTASGEQRNTVSLLIKRQTPKTALMFG